MWITKNLKNFPTKNFICFEDRIESLEKSNHTKKYLCRKTYVCVIVTVNKPLADGTILYINCPCVNKTKKQMIGNLKRKTKMSLPHQRQQQHFRVDSQKKKNIKS